MTGAEAVGRINALHGNRKFGVTGPDYGECTAVPHSLQREVLGLPIVYGNAKDIFANGSTEHYYKLAGNVQIEAGDIVVQGGDPVLGTSYLFGHVFVADRPSAPGQPIWGYSQNYPTGREPHYRAFPRNGLIGVLRAKVLSSGGGGPTVDVRYAEDWARVDYSYLFQRVPSDAERRLRVNLPWNEAAGAINGAVLNKSEYGLWNLLILMYEKGLGRDRNAKPGQPGYINIDAEIAPRVAQIVAGQNTPLNHFENIVASEEAKAYQDRIKTGGDPQAAQKLALAKQFAQQLKDGNVESLDKIINL